MPIVPPREPAMAPPATTTIMIPRHSAQPKNLQRQPTNRKEDQLLQPSECKKRTRIAGCPARSVVGEQTAWGHVAGYLVF
jgi:hypothetical protein